MKCTCGAIAVNSNIHTNWCDSHTNNAYGDGLYTDDDRSFIFPPLIPASSLVPTGNITFKVYDIKMTVPTASAYILNTCVSYVDEYVVADMKRNFQFTTTITNGKEVVDFGMLVLEER